MTDWLDRTGVGREIGLVAAHSIPQLANGDPELLEETVLAATSNVAAIIDGLRNGTAPQDIPVPGVSRQWVEQLLAHDVDASAIPWAYNFGHGRMSDALRDAVVKLDLSGEQRWALGEELTRYVRIYVESVCAQLVDHYVHAQQETCPPGTQALRRATIQQLLRGEPVDVANASRELGYDLRGHHLAALVWSASGPDTRPSASALQDAAQCLLRSCGASHVLAINNPDGSAWAWGAGEHLSERLGEHQLVASGMLAAIGTVARGSQGFVRTHEDAQRARRVAMLLGRRPRSIVTYRAVALTALVAQDPEQALRFVEGELGSLTDDTDSARRLRATLGVYLEEGLRPVRAARRLGIHQNTVTYRVAQAEQAIGRPLTDRRLELETALRLAEALSALRAAAADRSG